MKFVSFNVNGLRSILKKTFIEDFTNMNADIFSFFYPLFYVEGGENIVIGKFG